MKRAIVLAIILNSLLLITAEAHHGKNYLITGSYELPKPGSFFALLSFNVLNRLGERSYGLEPGILVGITHRWDAEVHVHHGFDGGEFHTEAIAVESRFGLVGEFSHEDKSQHETGNEDRSSPFGISVLMEFEKGFQEHPDNYEVRLIGGTTFGAYTLAANFILEGNLGDRLLSDSRYAIGVKKTFLDPLALGLEVDGAVQSISSIRFTPGLYLAAGDRFDVKLGVTLRANSVSEENMVRLAAVYQVN